MRMFFERGGQQFYDSKFDIAKLSHIENPAVKVFCPQNYWRLKTKGLGSLSRSMNLFEIYSSRF